MGSLFIPDDFVLEPVSRRDLNLAGITWGFTLGFSFLTAVKAADQTIAIWRRTRSVTVYVALIWGELLVSTIFGFICWFYLTGRVPPSFAFYFSILTMWALQVQFLLQIIINRIGLLIPNKRKVSHIKWGVAVLITLVNISVYCIWVPARLQISERYVHINEIWDRIEKGIYLVVDGILNWYFLRLVNSKLIRAGITKYKKLYNFNSVIVGVSLSMDVLIIAMMSLPNTFVYMQFHPLAYLVKLNIEMSMADLIMKVAKEQQNDGRDSSNAANNSNDRRPPSLPWAGGRNHRASIAKGAYGDWMNPAAAADAKNSKNRSLSTWSYEMDDRSSRPKKNSVVTEKGYPGVMVGTKKNMSISESSASGSTSIRGERNVEGEGPFDDREESGSGTMELPIMMQQDRDVEAGMPSPAQRGAIVKTVTYSVTSEN